jgi:hypothetical protein
VNCIPAQAWKARGTAVTSAAAATMRYLMVVHRVVAKSVPPFAHFQAKHALGLDPRVDTGSPSETRSNKEKEDEVRFH